jgi:PilZ domain
MRLPGWVEREEREPVSIGASVVLPDGRSVPVTIRDVSAHGCCVECDEALPIAQTVRLDLGDDCIEAEVRWALPGAAGLRLTNQNVERSWAAGRR